MATKKKEEAPKVIYTFNEDQMARLEALMDKKAAYEETIRTLSEAAGDLHEEIWGTINIMLPDELMVEEGMDYDPNTGVLTIKKKSTHR